MAESAVVIPDDMTFCASVDDAKIIHGRRSFFVYRDFDVEEPASLPAQVPAG